VNEAVRYVREAALKQSRGRLPAIDHGDSVMFAIGDLFYREYFNTKLAEMNALRPIPAGK
jgi:hypothetical protein